MPTLPELYNRSRVIVPTSLSSADLSQIKTRSLALARVTNATFLGEVKNQVQKVVEGNQTETKARQELSRIADELGYEGGEGITTLRSDARLRLIVQMQAEQAFGYGQWRAGQHMDVLKVYPAQELYRAAYRKEPRDWPTRWIENGGELFPGFGGYSEGRMIALKDSPIWEAISAFGNPYPPFDFNSGMDIRDIERAEAVELGLLRPGTLLLPQHRDFDDDLGMAEPELDDDLKEALLDELGEGYEFADGILQRANESTGQLINRYLVKNLQLN